MEERCPCNRRPSNACFFALIVAIQRQFVTGLEKEDGCVLESQNAARTGPDKSHKLSLSLSGEGGRGLHPVGTEL